MITQIKKSKTITVTVAAVMMLGIPLFAQDDKKKNFGDHAAEVNANQAEEGVEKQAETEEATKKEATEQDAQDAQDTKDAEADAVDEQPDPKKDSTGKIYKEGNVYHASCNTKFKLRSGDALSKLSYVEYRIDDSPAIKYGDPFEIEQEGMHRITYRGIDRVGNREPENTFEVIVDCTAPAMSYATKPAFEERDGIKYLPKDAEIEIAAIDQYSGIGKIEYTFDDGKTWQEYKSPIKMTEPGNQVLRFRAADKLDNTSEDMLFTALVDDKPPVIQIKSDQKLISVGGKSYSRRGNIFRLFASDVDSGINKILIKSDNDKDFQTYTTPLSFDVEGEHLIEAKAIDKVGNESKTVKISFLVDNNPPKTVLTPMNVTESEGSLNSDEDSLNETKKNENEEESESEEESKNEEENKNEEKEKEENSK